MGFKTSKPTVSDQIREVTMDRIIRNLKLAVICFGISTSLTLAAQTPALRSQALLQVNGSITSSVRSGVVFGPALRSALTSRSELMKEILRHDAASARSYRSEERRVGKEC